MSKSRPQKDSHAEPLPDYEIDAVPTFRAKVRAGFLGRRFAFAMILVALVAVAAWQGPPLYREAKARHALGLIAQGESAIESGDMTSASAFFRRAMLMAPGDPRVIEKVNLQNASFGNAEALAGLRSKVEDRSASPVEAIVVAEQSVRSGDFAMTTQALNSLPPSIDPALDGRRACVMVRLLLLQGQPDASIRVARDASNRLAGRDGDGARLLLAELLLRAKPPLEAEASSLLVELAAKPTREGVGALRLLAQYRTLHPDAAVLPAEQITALLRKHPSRSSADDLLLADLALAARPQQRASILSTLAAEQANRPLKERVVAGRWLTSRQAYAEAARLITEDDAVGDSDSLLVRMDALSGQNLWRESRALLEKARTADMPDVLRHLFLARIAGELGHAAEAEDEWSAVRAGLQLADPPAVRFVAFYAEACRRRAEAAAAFRLLANRPETRIDGLLGLTRTLPPSTPAAESLEIYRQLLAAAPDLADARCGVAYFSLLTNRDLEKSRDLARQLFRSKPGLPAFQSVAALAELRSHDPAAALKFYETPAAITGSPRAAGVDWPSVADNWKAVRVAVLQANGQTAQAAALRSTIHPENLRPEEQDLLHTVP